MKHFIMLKIRYNNLDDAARALQAVNYHFASELITISNGNNCMKISLHPLDPKLFGLQEGVDIMSLTLTHSPYFTSGLQCTFRIQEQND